MIGLGCNPIGCIKDGNVEWMTNDNNEGNNNKNEEGGRKAKEAMMDDCIIHFVATQHHGMGVTATGRLVVCKIGGGGSRWEGWDGSLIPSSLVGLFGCCCFGKEEGMTTQIESRNGKWMDNQERR